MFAQGIKQLVKKKLEYTLSSLRHFWWKEIQKRTLKALKKNFILLKRSILVFKISQVKDDKAKHTWSQRTTTKLKKFEKTIKKSSKQES